MDVECKHTPAIPKHHTPCPPAPSPPTHGSKYAFACTLRFTFNASIFIYNRVWQTAHQTRTTISFLTRLETQHRKTTHTHTHTVDFCLAELLLLRIDICYISCACCGCCQTHQIIYTMIWWPCLTHKYTKLNGYGYMLHVCVYTTHMNMMTKPAGLVAGGDHSRIKHALARASTRETRLCSFAFACARRLCRRHRFIPPPTILMRKLQLKAIYCLSRTLWPWSSLSSSHRACAR